MSRGLRRTHKEDPYTKDRGISEKELILTICQLNKSGLNMLEYLVKWDILAKSEDVSFFYFNRNFFYNYD